MPAELGLAHIFRYSVSNIFTGSKNPNLRYFMSGKSFVFGVNLHHEARSGVYGPFYITSNNEFLSVKILIVILKDGCRFRSL